MVSGQVALSRCRSYHFSALASVERRRLTVPINAVLFDIDDALLGTNYDELAAPITSHTHFPLTDSDFVA